jgi:hypothetical protein
VYRAKNFSFEKNEGIEGLKLEKKMKYIRTGRREKNG